MASSCPHEPSHWIEKLLHPDAKARHHPFHSIRFRSAPLQKKTEARPDCSAFPTGSVLPYLAGTPFRHKQTRQIDVACNMDSKRQASRTPVRHRPAKLKTDTRGKAAAKAPPRFPELGGLRDRRASRHLQHGPIAVQFERRGTERPDLPW